MDDKGVQLTNLVRQHMELVLEHKRLQELSKDLSVSLEGIWVDKSVTDAKDSLDLYLAGADGQEPVEA